MSRELGILFKPDMHLAIREGRKTQTRRRIKKAVGAEDVWGGKEDGLWSVHRFGDPCNSQIKPKYRVGDLLYVKEGWIEGFPTGEPNQWSCLRPSCFKGEHGKPFYRMDANDPVDGPQRNWKSALFMPKWAARTWLAVTEVRAERLQAISEEDAVAEGFSAEPTPTQEEVVQYPEDIREFALTFAGGIFTAKFHFMERWDSINGHGSWSANPWVWVYMLALRATITNHAQPEQSTTRLPHGSNDDAGN